MISSSQLHGKRILKLLQKIFSWLPLATIIDQKVLVVHGGISDTTDLGLLTKIDRHRVCKPHTVCAVHTYCTCILYIHTIGLHTYMHSYIHAYNTDIHTGCPKQLCTLKIIEKRVFMKIDILFEV